MKRMWILVLFVLTCAGTLSASARERGVTPTPSINASATGKVSAKPDVAIVFMTIRSTSSLTADAVEQNNRKIEAVKAKLTELGYNDDMVKFSGNRFSLAGGRAYYPPGQQPPGFDVYDNFCVYIQGPELNDAAQFNKKVSLLLDGLSKVGASPNNLPSSYPGASSIVVFALKDATPYEKEATAQAFEKVRPQAEEIAKHMNVRITGTAYASVSSTGRPSLNLPPMILDDLPYEHLSYSIDAVPIQMRVDIRYTYK